MLFQEHIFEGRIVFDDLTEYFDSHLLLKTRRNHVDEPLELFLLRFGTDCEDEERSDFFLKEWRQVHVLHSGVSNINLLLELRLLSATHLGLHSHVTE